MSKLDVTIRGQAGQPPRKGLEALKKGFGDGSLGATQPRPAGALEGRPFGEVGHLVEAAVRCSNEAILITDAQLKPPGPKIVFVNEAFCRLTGYRSEEILGQTPRVLQGPETEPGFCKRLKRALRVGRPFRGEVTNYRKDRSPYIAECYVSPVVGPGGEVTNYVATQRETTDRKRAEQASRESEARLKLALEAAQIGTWVWDVEAGSFHWDERLHAMFGFSRDAVQVSYERFLAMIHREDVERVNTAFGRALDEVAEYDIDFRVVWPDASVHSLSSRGAVLLDSRGRRLRMTGVCLDITERKRSEEALRNSEARLRAIMETAVDAIIAMDQHGVVESLNPAAENMFGYQALELVGQNAKILIPPPHREHYGQALADFLQSGANGKCEALGQRSDGETFPAELAVSEFGTGETRRFAAIIRDISERNRVEQERHQYMLEMEAAKRTTDRQAQELAASNAELRQFAYIASHDLQEPLRMVAGYTQLLAKRSHDRLDPEAQEFVTFILDGVKRMRQLITDLLAYSRAGRAETFGPVEMEECVRGSLANLKAALEESRATVEHEPLPEVRGDRTQLTQLFQNLIGNALKYRSQQAPKVRIRVEPKPEEWLFAIEDNGIGIDPKYHERIFQVFQRLHTREEYAGTGIGLAICKKIVESHSGRIWVESEPGRGSTFFFSLPAQGVAPR